MNKLSEIAEESEDKGCRSRAVQALGQIGDPSAIGHLERTLADKDEHVRRDSATALGEIGSPDAVPMLVKSPRGFRRYCRYALSVRPREDRGTRTPRKISADCSTEAMRSQDTMCCAIQYVSIANAASFALQQLMGEGIPDIPLFVRTQSELSDTRNQWRKKLGLAESELPDWNENSADGERNPADNRDTRQRGTSISLQTRADSTVKEKASSI